MKFIIDKDTLLNNLQLVLGPTTTKQNFPILSSVLISSTQNILKFITTDLDLTIISTQQNEIQESGRIAIPMKRFSSIVRELPNQPISIQTTKNNLLIKCGKIEFKINTLNPDEFPKIEEGKKASLIKISPDILSEMIKLTSFSVGHEDTNYVLNGILFEIKNDTITLASTDGKRLSVIKKKLPSSQPEIASKLSFIVPIKAINELNKLIKEHEDEVFLFVEENRVGFDFKDGQFICRPIEGEFPNYSQYIPKEGNNKLKVNKNEFLGALKRADLLSTPDYQGVKFELKKDTLTMSKNTPQLGEAKESLGVSYEGAAIQLGFNPQYLIDVLKNIDDEEVVFDFFGEDKPAVMRKEGFVYLVLPMKL